MDCECIHSKIHANIKIHFLPINFKMSIAIQGEENRQKDRRRADEVGKAHIIYAHR